MSHPQSGYSNEPGGSSAGASAPAGQPYPPAHPQYQPQQPHPGQPYPQLPVPVTGPAYAYGNAAPQPVYVTPRPEPKNGLGLAALIMAIVGLASCVIPLVGPFVGGPLSIVSLILGLVGWSRARKGVATNKKTAIWATFLAVACFIFAIVDVAILVNAANDFGNCLDATSNALDHVDDQSAQNAADKACQTS
jgi:hypothetical protein